MIEAIKRLRKENSKLLKIWKALPPALMKENAMLRNEADWLASKLELSLPYESAEGCNARYWREAARNAVASPQEGLASSEA